MSNYTWYVFVDDLSLWLQNNLKEGAKPDWDGESVLDRQFLVLANGTRFSSRLEFLKVVAPAKSLLSDRAHYGLCTRRLQPHVNSP